MSTCASYDGSLTDEMQHAVSHTRYTYMLHQSRRIKFCTIASSFFCFLRNVICILLPAISSWEFIFSTLLCVNNSIPCGLCKKDDLFLALSLYFSRFLLFTLNSTVSLLCTISRVSFFLILNQEHCVVSTLIKIRHRLRYFQASLIRFRRCLIVRCAVIREVASRNTVATETNDTLSGV